MHAEEVYDPFICFHTQVTLSSSIKTLYIFTGILAEVFFGVHPERGFEPKDDGVWDPEPKSEGEGDDGKRIRGMDVYGTGNEPWYFTTEADAGKFSIAVVTGPDAEKGGFSNLVSWVASLRDVKEAYESVHEGARVKISNKGTIQELERRAVEGKEKFGREKWWEYHRLWFQLFTIRGDWNLGESDNEKFPMVEATGLERFLRDNRDI